MSTPELITLGLGIVFSMIYDIRTGLGSGGLVSAGLLALSVRSPSRVISCIAAAMIICPFLDLAVRRLGLHGRVRIGCAMLAALAIRLAVGAFIYPVPWVGWVVPALIAADMQRQGILLTLSSVISVVCLTALSSQTVFLVGSVMFR